MNWKRKKREEIKEIERAYIECVAAVSKCSRCCVEIALISTHEWNKKCKQNRHIVQVAKR